MRKAVVFYFSGTGNTEYVARLVHAELRRNGVDADLLPLDFLAAPDLAPYDGLFLGFPVHGYGVPVPVRGFIARLPPTTGKRAVAFCTYGGLSLGAELWGARLLQERGLTPVGTLGVRMPHNNPPGVDVSKQPVARLAQRAAERVRAALPELIGATQPICTTSVPNRLVASWLNPLAVEHQLFDFAYAKKVSADERCTRCMLCIHTCPTRSLWFEDGRLRAGSGCASCLRCFNACPNQAITFDAQTATAPRYRGPLGDYRSPIAPHSTRSLPRA